MRNRRSPIIEELEDRGLNEFNDIRYGPFQKITLVFGLIAALHFSQGALRGFGEIENISMAKVNGVPVIEQSYADYMCLGAKNLAGKVYSTLK
ncbi:hypothetical protein GOV13_03575 [Candidatus Pacearchaeota archaeon]|nr:hypothetical protein [Candidatus Pacearchaeota archaeon]